VGIWKRLTERLRGGTDRAGDTGTPPSRRQTDPDAAGGEPALPGADAERYLRGLVSVPDHAQDVEVGRAVEELQRAGRELMALELLRRLLSLRPHDADLRERYADLLLDRLDDAGATRELEALWESPPHAARAAFLLGEVHERAGDRDGALRWYERVLSRDVRHPNARERADRLRLDLGFAAGGAATPTLFTPDGAALRDRFRLVRELGRGGAGTVYLADEVQVDRQVALKVYHPDQWTHGGPGRRFVLEARTAASLRHPGIIRILDVDITLRAIVMEVVPAGTVASYTKSSAPPLTEAKVLDLVRRVLEPLAFVHRHGIVHRDLKPSNLLLRADGGVVLSDFGVALVPGDEAGAREAIGTFAYMPPETRRGGPATAAADVFAVGTLLGELLARAPDAGAASADLVARLTATDPAARPRDAAAALGMF
jgi:serine/threonine-protein kinase